ncbi:MAG: polymorphic toxin type 33 domain-containing protein [Geobacteraceae bacterium]|nr:polymorphic toxin type 33 domain-containing protein [Geobacteraceae bacterium]
MKIFLPILFIILIMVQTAGAAEQVFFYHTDPAGTPLAMTNSSGTVVWKADYKPFGEEQSVTSTIPNDKRFVGKEKDTETGLSYFGARYESDKIGRFISPDPVRAVDEKTSRTNEKMLLNPQRLNTYAYGLNNPYRYVDPDGREPLSELGNRMVSSEAFIRFGEAIGASQLNAALTGYDFRGNEISGAGRLEQLGLALMSAPVSPGKTSANALEKMEGVALAKDMRKVTKGEIKMLKNAGEDIHAIKGTGGASQYDLYKDKSGEIFQFRKGGKGGGESTGLNMKNYKE